MTTVLRRSTATCHAHSASQADLCMQRANGCADLAVGACAQLHTSAGVGNISVFRSQVRPADRLVLCSTAALCLLNGCQPVYMLTSACFALSRLTISARATRL